MPRFLRKAVALCATVTVLTFCGVTAVTAAPGDSITLYLSAPLVQGSSVSGAGTASDNFNNYSTGACPTSTGIGTLTPSTGLACGIQSVKTYGGASSTSATPAYGGSGSNFPALPYPAPGTVTFSFTSPVKYVGFWWSAGNNGNTVEFLNGGTVIAQYTTTTLMTLLGSAPWNHSTAYPSGNGSLTSLDGSSYPKGLYFGNPRGFSTSTPSSYSTIEPDYPFVYMNLYLGGGLTADSVRFSGDGFEFDNITTSTVAQTPQGSMVLAGGVLGHSVQFVPNATGTSGSMTVQTETSTANLTDNAFTRAGYTFSGWTTQASGGGTSYANQQTYNFSADLTLYAQWTAVLPAQTMTWSPTNLTINTSPSLPNVNATTTGDGAITYSVVDPGNSGCTVNATTGQITYISAGACTVRATAAATANFSAAHVDNTFTLELPTQLVSTGFNRSLALQSGLLASFLLFSGAAAYFHSRRKSH
jgi:uncharacterized repeat protein (TIGR02543 family)